MNDTSLKELIKRLPPKPGIYIFRSKTRKPLYIGKALNLKSRIKNYPGTDDPRLKRMIAESDKLEIITTDSDIEALILESKYIKKFQPPFNIMLRDDKQYFYVEFSKDKFSRISLTHQPVTKYNLIRPDKEAPSFIGPFTDGNAIKTVLKLLRRIFPYCTCRQLHNNYCLNYHIEKCPGFCCLKSTNLSEDGHLPEGESSEQKAYKKNIKAIRDILSGKKESLITDFEKEMKKLSDKKEFEKAIELQNKISKLKRVFQNAQIIQDPRYSMRDTTGGRNQEEVLKQLAGLIKTKNKIRRIECYDIANIQGKHAVGGMIVFTNGIPDKNEYRKFKIYGKQSPDDTAMLKEILTRRLNHSEWPYPDLIVIDGGKGQLNAAIEALHLFRPELQIPVLALTKNERHVGEKIFIANRKEAIPVSKLPDSTRNLLLHLDSEAHRFSISYYRQIHRKRLRG